MSNLAEAMEFFLGKGWTKEQAAGICGNLMHESGMDPTQKQHGGPAYGLAQWEEPRLSHMKAFVKTLGLPYDNLQAQLSFIQHELETTESNAAKKLKAVTTGDNAAMVFCVFYERPGKPALASRLDWARNIYSGSVG